MDGVMIAWAGTRGLWGAKFLVTFTVSHFLSRGVEAASGEMTCLDVFFGEQGALADLILYCRRG